jgi:hypothetical protein
MDKLEINLIEDSHEYIVMKNGEPQVVDLSVTQLLSIVGLKPNFSGVSEEVLAKASERGTQCHKEMEEYINKKGEVEPSVNEDVLNSQMAMSNHFDIVNDRQYAELPIALEYKGHLFVGTIDYLNLTAETLLDHKFTSSLYDRSVEAQLNIYAYALRHFSGSVNGIELNNEKVNHLIANHKGNFKEFAVWDDNRVEYLLDCYIDEMPYIDERELQTIEVGGDLIAQEYELAHFEEKVKQLEDLIKSRREAILNEMLEKGIKSYTISGVKYTVKEAFVRESLDSTKLKKEMPELFEKYKKQTKVKPSLLIKIGEEE